MGTIHLASTIVLFLFGGVFVILGILLFMGFEASKTFGYYGIALLGIGTVLIIVGVEIAKRSKNN